jgi:translation elongation factor EF-G
MLMHANNREDIKVARAGDIVAIGGLKDVITGGWGGVHLQGVTKEHNRWSMSCCIPACGFYCAP